MSTSITLKVSVREETGRSASRRLRRANQVPAIVYGKHTDPEKLSVDGRDFIFLLRKIAGRKLIIELENEGRENTLSFLKEVQRDAITDRYLHVDFQEIRADETFEVEVPVVVKGESIGVKMHNGVLEISSHSVRVRCLPKHLPGAIELDITDLDVEQSIKVETLPALEGVEYRDNPGQAVVSIVMGEAPEEPKGGEEAAAE